MKKNCRQLVLSAIAVMLLTQACGYGSTKKIPEKTFYRIRVIQKEIHSPEDIVNITDSLVVPYVYTRVVSLQNLPVSVKKQKFIGMMLPAVLVAKTQIDLQRNRLLLLTRKTSLSSSDSVFLWSLIKKYKTTNTSELLKRMHTFPVSIILAQAANESGWGSSRFFIEADNPFGIWSFNANESRIAASKSRNGKVIYLRKFNNLAEAIDAYYVMLSTRKIFSPFQEAIQKTNDPFALVRALSSYSERGNDYVNDLIRLIKNNKLHQYDTYKIAPAYFEN